MPKSEREAFLEIKRKLRDLGYLVYLDSVRDLKTGSFSYVLIFTDFKSWSGKTHKRIKGLIEDLLPEGYIFRTKIQNNIYVKKLPFSIGYISKFPSQSFAVKEFIIIFLIKIIEKLKEKNPDLISYFTSK